jgi:hypothetical protein
MDTPSAKVIDSALRSSTRFAISAENQLTICRIVLFAKKVIFNLHMQGQHFLYDGAIRTAIKI